MIKDNIILIKIGESYREGLSAEELYNSTSISWVISESKLKSGDLEYYCAIYDNKIKEVYRLNDFKKDTKRLGRFILIGDLAEESIRSQLLGLDLGDIHKGKGNPIKYHNMDQLLQFAKSSKANREIHPELDQDNQNNHSRIKELLVGLANKVKEIQSLRSENPQWITKVDKEGLYVETISSREKYSNGEKQHPYDIISFDFLLEAWNEFVSSRKVAASHFVKTKGRSSFLMAFFNELPFVEKLEEERTIFIQLKEFTTDQLPEANLEQVKELLNEIIHDNLEPNLISQRYPDDATKRLKLRARQGLKILGFLSEDFTVNVNTIKKYTESYHKEDFLKERMIQHPYSSIVLSLLPFLTHINKNEKLAILTEVGMLIVRNSMGCNLMLESVSTYRNRNVLNWFKNVGLVDEVWNLLESDISSQYVINTGENLILENNLEILNMDDIITHIDQYIASKGFYYAKQEIQNLYLSLRTKPFVILSGISGTGKTMIIKWFAESVGATEENGQFTLIPVRPDWNDGSDLLGYINIAGNFKQGPLTATVKKALDNPERPYFVLLDEMNLARVEYYLSDILSVMESRELKNGRIITSPLLNNHKDGKPIYLPENVYIIGTVNMDETTHPFSKKVLDRANTIEFNEVRLDYLKFLEDIPSVPSIKLHNLSFVSRYIHLKDVYLIYSDIVKRGTEQLVIINEILKPIGAHIGYRVRDEICFYLAYNQEGKLMSFEQAMDRCIIQKILPRISGSDTRVEGILKRLFRHFTNRELVHDLEHYEEDISLSRYPLSAHKTYEMLRRLRDDGFTSFWIS